ncbi:hypothetical protein GUITHDRAFT_109431 [Guillardia theta CCMP2712]|uniref:ZZ-type domain-containing protein n=1 Tax=Guillardia theta (strain CCMP2712) TaxID=905079 RepID=L1J9A7_GUITC|nr:hypothetical protein GUITHDRAFT_109431 [Guillardia theta CCMP2712]EKX44655.1 hypothetical protein GUITHDRAFT_109431 [Guillardia theta CCMP2712]|eukprot:XP_005831635.1 hypothetical protein GUITHDRAFT_109431 [Guillardia theta CCMP2712]
MGRDKMIALDADGNLFFTGKLGNNDKECRFKKMRAVVAASQQPACARDISLRAEVAVLLDGEGRIWEGGVARESKILSLSLSTISGDDAKFSSLSCGRFHSLALSNGSQVFSWGSFARGELNADMSLGFLQSRMLDVISLPALGATKHTGVVCINCKSDNISGVRYISIARDADKRSMQSLCARCVERDNMLKSEVALDMFNHQQVLLACHRKLPPHFRPSIANIDLTTGQTHHGTGCDSCSENPIAGIRYKCCNCDQYNLYASRMNLVASCFLWWLVLHVAVNHRLTSMQIYPQITIDIFARNKNGD